MDPNINPDPVHLGWFQGAGLFLLGLLISVVHKYFSRHETENDKETEDVRLKIKKSEEILAQVHTRLSLLEDRKYVTLPELRIAIGEAINEAQKLFTPQHQELAVEFRAVVKESKKETEDIVRECNNAIRRDFGSALSESTSATKKASEALEQSAKLMERIVIALEQSGVERRKKR